MKKSKVADNIRQIIDAHGYKYVAIAQRAGYTKQQMSDMLTGRKMITADDLIRLKEAIGCTYDELFADSGKSA